MNSSLALRERRRSLWAEFHSLAETHAPTCRFPEISNAVERREFSTDGRSRPDMIANTQVIEASMKEAHDGFVHGIKTTEYTQVHIPGTEGIVSSTTKTYLPMFLASLRMLRYTGCTVPVELFLSDEWNYDGHLCERVLPLYDASCIVLSRLFNSSNKVDVQHSQLKAFAVLLSSFENVIYMDPWSLPTYSASTARPCADDSLTTWPGHWASTVNPIYYNISGQPVPSMAARPASDTSAFFVSKRSHLTTLFLNAYYNYHGPSYYYPLFGQGGPGDPGGDSLLLAAAALGQSFLMIQDPEADVGYQALDGEFYSSAVVQIDPQNVNFHRVACFRNTETNRQSFFNYTEKQLVRRADQPFSFSWSGLTSNNKLYRLRTQWVTPQGELSRLTEGPEWDYWKNIQSTNCLLKSAVNVWKAAAAEHWKGLQNDICLLALWYWKMASRPVTISSATSHGLPVGSPNSILDTALPPISERREPVTNSSAVSLDLTTSSRNSMPYSTLPSIPEVPEPDSVPPSPREGSVDDHCLSCCRGAYRLNGPGVF
ncbi:hypothetical protein P168DRAFT_284879 [Aspergillus campestris IBT 28561]|uniref:Uncharacterized protein n=1 Tax=Aspergillus campestris (strain IBT 28561) TaxID=1392248 RepID=A0A2I1CSW7_ASPC2|nr:uncharacterized protein P168DRAFT_284879 [Aspergillus campestris IBT 28561]PKY00707.1 hypothetical protein P168DRAFT_284879 [Aspergillus campestris IBT 28561]